MIQIMALGLLFAQQAPAASATPGVALPVAGLPVLYRCKALSNQLNSSEFAVSLTDGVVTFVEAVGPARAGATVSLRPSGPVLTNGDGFSRILTGSLSETSRVWIVQKGTVKEHSTSLSIQVDDTPSPVDWNLEITAYCAPTNETGTRVQ